MEKKVARWNIAMILFAMCIVLFACAAPIKEASPPARSSATDAPSTPEASATIPPTAIPPTPTAERPMISVGNVWDLIPLFRFEGLGNGIRTVAFDPAGDYLAAITGGNSQGLDHSVRVWSTGSGELIGQSAELGVDIWDVAFSPRGDSLAIGLHNGQVILYTRPDLKKLTTFSHPGQVNSVAYSPDGMYLAAGVAEADGGMIYLWNVDQGVLVRRSWAHPYSVPSLAFSPSGQLLASGAVDRSVKIWQLSNGELLRTLDQAGQGQSLSFSPGGEWLGSGMCSQSTTGFKCVEGQVWLWDVDSGALDKQLSGPIDWVDAVAFSADSALVVGGARDYAIYLWDRTSGSMLRSIASHQGGVEAVAVSRDGRFLASGASDESVILWAIAP
jgi:WD40 repeat protein